MLYLAPEARFDYLLTLPEAADIGAKINAAMREVEKYNPQLADVLPKTFNLFTGTMLKELLKKISEIPATLDLSAFGRIYDYFLDAFAMSEGRGRGRSRGRVLEVALTAAMTLSRIFRHRRHTRSSSALYTGKASKAGAAQNGYQRYTRSLSHKLSSGTKVIMARQPPTTNT